jgi:hypothetical protein
MSALRQAFWELRHAPEDTAVTARARANLRRKLGTIAAIAVQSLFAIGVYAYVAWCVLK